MPLIYFMVWMYRWISFIILQKNTSMALSTTIIRASPTPPVEPFDNGNVFSSSKSPEPLCHSEIPGPNKKTSELGSRSQSDFCKDYENEYSKGNRQSEPGPRLYTQRDSGYSNKLNIQHPSGTASEQARQVLPHVLGSGSCFGAADDLTYGSVPSYTSQGALTNLPNPLTGCSLFSSQLAQQYLSSEGPLHAPPYQIGGPSGLYGVSATNPSMGHMHVPRHTRLQSGYQNSGQQHPPQYPVSKTYGQPSVGSWAARDLVDLKSKWKNVMKEWRDLLIGKKNIFFFLSSSDGSKWAEVSQFLLCGNCLSDVPQHLQPLWALAASFNLHHKPIHWWREGSKSVNVV